MNPKVIYIGYDSSLKGGIQNVSDLIKNYFPEVLFHSSITDSNSKFAYILFSIVAYFRYVLKVSKNRPKVAHIVIASPLDQIRNLPYIVISRLSRIRILLHFRYNIGPAFRNMPRFLSALVKRFYRMANLLVFLSETLRRDFQENVDFLTSICIPNPISSQYLKVKSLSFEQRTQTVIYLGRFSREKGIHDLLEAARMHSQSDDSVKYHFYGDGLYPRRYPVNCQFHKWISGKEKLEVLRTARVLVLPSYNEAFPNVILEALSCGTPVVCTQVGGVSDIITHGLHGLLINPGDPLQLLRGIKRLIYDSEFWTSCSLKGRKLASEYDAQNILKLWQNIYVHYAFMK